MIASPAFGGGGGKSELSRARCHVTRGPVRVHPEGISLDPEIFGIEGHPEGTESATENRPPPSPAFCGIEG